MTKFTLYDYENYNCIENLLFLKRVKACKDSGLNLLPKDIAVILDAGVGAINKALKILENKDNANKIKRK